MAGVSVMCRYYGSWRTPDGSGEYCRTNIRLAEILPYKPQRFPGRFGQRVGGAIREVERLAGQVRLFDCDWLDDDFSPPEEYVALAARLATLRPPWTVRQNSKR